MKISFFTFIMILFATNDCSNQQVQTVNSITYETFTRGSSTVYSISPNTIHVKSTGLNARENSESITADDWKTLMERLAQVNVANINQLQAPSDSRASDAALHAILSIRKNDTIYKTNSFDHGNAPDPIKPLVEAILRLAENVE